MEIRLNKYISESGFCSRREADRFIEGKRVTINGKTAEMGTKVKPGDKVKVNGILLENDIERVYIALHKPVGIVSTTDPSEPNNISEYVNYPTRIFNIGRLDKPSEGLILLTNDGNIVNKILRAANNHEKEYEVIVDKPITEEFIKAMGQGVPILGQVTRKCKISQEDRFKFKIILTQGLNRQIRRMCEYLGYEVVRLKRLRIMNIKLGKLPVGHWRMLSDDEIAVLNRNLEDSVGTQSSPSKSSAKAPQRGSSNATKRPARAPKSSSSSRELSRKPKTKNPKGKSLPKRGIGAKSTATRGKSSGRGRR